jgi:hypothetical protein
MSMYKCCTTFSPPITFPSFLFDNCISKDYATVLINLEKVLNQEEFDDESAKPEVVYELSFFKELDMNDLLRSED